MTLIDFSLAALQRLGPPDRGDGDGFTPHVPDPQTQRAEAPARRHLECLAVHDRHALRG
jgi:hypothetical protein